MGAIVTRRCRSAWSSSSPLRRRARSPATSGRTSSSSPPSATSATSPTAPPRSPRSTRASPGRASASTSSTGSSRSTSSIPDKKKTVAQLKKQLAGADELLLATDEDREGEAIAWHLLEVLQPKVPVRRMVFHEITRHAIEQALEETREVDERLVDAQESRRILDRLYGYEVSPVLWKKVMRGLSAGRVQSVATRLVVERERERMAFRAAEWWDLLATFDPESVRGAARLRRGAARRDGTRLRAGREAAWARRASSTRRRRAGSPSGSKGRPSRSPASSGSRTSAARVRRS